MPANSVKFRENPWLIMNSQSDSKIGNLFNENLRGTGHGRRGTKKFVRIFKLFIQNKAKVKLAKIKLSSFVTSKYE
jgi:hypothetical protein